MIPNKHGEIKANHMRKYNQDVYRRTISRMMEEVYMWIDKGATSIFR